MIEGSIESVQDGTTIAQQTASALATIVTDITKAADLVANIASASEEQAQGVGQINQGISQVSQVVQSNSANAEESAAASEELAGQAELLREQVSKFKLKERMRSGYDTEGMDKDMAWMLEHMQELKKYIPKKTSQEAAEKPEEEKPSIVLTGGYDKY
jgi:methyl-accepting chemotaxis protein